MLRKRKHLPTYPDGIVEVYEDASGKSSIGAKRNPRSLEDLKLVHALCYSEEGVRESDQAMAHQQSVTIALKVRTPFVEGVNAKQKAVVAGRLYDIVRVDPAKRSQLYLYLSGGRVLDGDHSRADQEEA